VAASDDNDDSKVGSAATTPLHMDTCKMKHEESASQTNSIQISNLLQADSLEKRGAMASDEQVEESPRGIAAQNGFEIIEHDEELKQTKAKSESVSSSNPKKKLS